MIMWLIGLLFLELLLLTASVVEIEMQPAHNPYFLIAMSIVLASMFLLLMILYIPLFSTIMERLRVALPITYQNIRLKVTVGFFALMGLMLLRYLIYLSF